MKQSAKIKEKKKRIIEHRWNNKSEIFRLRKIINKTGGAIIKALTCMILFLNCSQYKYLKEIDKQRVNVIEDWRRSYKLL